MTMLQVGFVSKLRRSDYQIYNSAIFQLATHHVTCHILSSIRLVPNPDSNEVLPSSSLVPPFNFLLSFNCLDQIQTLLR